MMLPQERLREISGQITQRHGPKLTADYIALSMVHPRLGYAYWRIGLKTLENLRLRNNKEFYDARLVLRLYDVTAIRFDDAHTRPFTDLEISPLSGNYYIDIERIERDYVVEIGLRRNDGLFCPFARSNTTRFDRDNPVENHLTANLAMEAALTAIHAVADDFSVSTRARIPRPSYA